MQKERLRPQSVHDSQDFPALFAKLAPFHPNYIIPDSGYKNPSIAKCLLDQHITPVFAYTRPRGKKGMLRPNDFIYDEHYDVYLCLENQVLHYSTTNRSDYREYKSNPKTCATCPLLNRCTQSKTKQKLVTKHIWKGYIESCDEIRYQRGMKERYQYRKETIERLFGTAKEYHNREIGKPKMRDKVELTLAWPNLKKLVKMRAGKPFYFTLNHTSRLFFQKYHGKQKDELV